MTTRIQHLRELHGMSQEDLARAAGLNPGTVSRLERGLGSPHPATVRAVARALGVPPAAVIGPTADVSKVTIIPEAVVINRRARGLSRLELARRAGLSVMTAYRAEVHGGAVEVETLVKLADALGVEPGALSIEFDMLVAA